VVLSKIRRSNQSLSALTSFGASRVLRLPNLIFLPGRALSASASMSLQHLIQMSHPVLKDPAVEFAPVEILLHVGNTGDARLDRHLLG
jgi:hypothetical protein